MAATAAVSFGAGVLLRLRATGEDLARPSAALGAATG
jgi:hypothetical protein